MRDSPLDRAPLPAYTWRRGADGGFVLREHNQAATVITQGRIPGLVGKTAQQIYGARGRALEDDLARSLEDGPFTRRDVDFTPGTTGETRRFTITYVPHPPDTVMIYTEDVTHRARLQDQLRRAQKMDALGQLAAGLAHDFNNVVAAIEGAGAVLADALGPDSPHLREVDEIRQAGAHAASLLRQLLSLSKEQVAPRGSVDLGETARGLEPMLRRLIPDPIALRLEIAGDLHPVAADAMQMEQLVLNLALNARDAMPDGGVLTIAAANLEADANMAAELGLANAGEFVELAVTDTGVGMDAATRERAFDPFFTTKAPSRGTGLGLSIVYGVAQRSGGSVALESEVGRGTTVRVRLARARPIEDQAIAPSDAGEGVVRRVRRVLLVEDTAPVRRACRRSLAAIGFDVLEAATEEEALRVASSVEGPLDLLLTDVNIPASGGRALYENLRATRVGLRVLYISGHTQADLVRHGSVANGAPFLQKPFAFGDLVAAVRAVLGLSEADVARVP